MQKSITFLFLAACSLIALPVMAQLWPGTDGLILENGQHRSLQIKQILVETKNQQNTVLIGKKLKSKEKLVVKLALKTKTKTKSKLKRTILYVNYRPTEDRSASCFAETCFSKED